MVHSVQLFFQNLLLLNVDKHLLLSFFPLYLSTVLIMLLLFFWQFSHFIAIAWVLDEEYKKAGFKMLFGGEKGTYPAILSILSSVIMCLLSIIPFFWNQEQLLLSLYGFIIITFLGVWYTYHSIALFRHPEDKNAKKLMLASIAYLPLLQIVYILDKFVS